MIDRNLILARLASIRDRIARIRERLPGRSEEFLSDRDRQEIVTFNLFLAFQDSLDLAAHIIADRSWPVPATNRDHFDILASRKVLSPETADAMARCAGLRNLIAHNYGTLDPARLYAELPAGLAALEAFGAEVAATD